MSTKFVNTINAIVKAAGLTEQFQTESEFYLKIVPECDAWMPLVIEAYDGASTGIGKRNISVAHYYTQNGDLCADPDILMDELGRPIEITQWCGYKRIMEKRDDGQIYANKALMADVMSFMASWADNIKNGVWMDIVTTGQRGKFYMKFEGETVEVVKHKKTTTQATL
jgi:hypothetical protein